MTHQKRHTLSPAIVILLTLYLCVQTPNSWGTTANRHNIYAQQPKPCIAKAEDNAYSPIMLAVLKEDAQLLTQLLAEGHKPNLLSQGILPLHCAVYAQNSTLVHLLLQAGGEPDQKDSTGRTALHYLVQQDNDRYATQHPTPTAVIQNNLALIRTLLQAGADSNTPDNKGETPLHYASKYNNLPMTYLLLLANADINATSSKQHTPLHYATIENRGVLALLLEAKAASNLKTTGGETPLHLAIYVYPYTNNLESIHMLLQSKANVNAKTNYGSTPVDYAVMIVSPEILALLLNAQAKVTTQDSQGNTPLHHLFSHHLSSESLQAELDLLQLLLRAGADINAQNYNGETPLDKALKRKASPYLLNALKAAGAQAGDVHNAQSARE